MAIKDFFWFRKGEYEERINDRIKYSDERIHRERSHKSRQQFDGCWSIGNGLVCCVATGGLYTGVVLYDYRQRSVSRRKLELLEMEAEKRGMKKYDQGKRDFWISCISNSVRCFVGCKVDSCLAGMNEAPVPSYVKGVAQTTDNPLEAVAQEPKSAQMTDNPSKEEVEVNKQMQVQGQCIITQGLENAVSDPHALEKEVPVTRDAPVPSVQDPAGVQVKRPNTPVQGHDRITYVSESQVSETHTLEAGRRGMKKSEKRKRKFSIYCISNSVRFCIGSGAESCLIDMLPGALAEPNVQDVVRMTSVKPSAAGAQAEKLKTPVERQDGITLNEETQTSELYELEKAAGRCGIKKRGKGKRDFWISYIFNSVGSCIGADSFLADMLPGGPVPSAGNVVQMIDVKPSEAGAQVGKPIMVQIIDSPSEAGAQPEKLNTQMKGQDRLAVCEKNPVSEAHGLEKEAGRRGMKKRGKRKGDFWVFCISNSVGFCVGSGADSCLADMLPRAPVPSVEDVVQMTGVKPSQAGAQAGKPITVQITDIASDAEAQLEMPNTPVEKQDRITFNLEDHVSEPYVAACPTSDVQRASPVPGSELFCEGVEAAERRVAVASVLEADINGVELASNQMASSASQKVDKSSSITLPDLVSN